MLGRERKVALEHFSFAIDPALPGITAVVGESGSGKTTLARLLLGLIEPYRGRGLYEGRPSARPAQPRNGAQFRREVQAIFQDPYEVYNPFYRVDHVLTTPVRKFRLAPTRAERRGLIEEALRAVGLRPEEILGRYPHQLSGGQRQRIMVARALLLRPRLIVADEPVSMVDASLRATILGSLRKLNEELGISILYITHDLATAYQVADTILVLYRASVAEAGDVELVVKAPQHPVHAIADRLDPARQHGARLGGGGTQIGGRPGGAWLQIRRSLPGRDAPVPDSRAAALSHRSAPRRSLLPAQRMAEIAPRGDWGSVGAGPDAPTAGSRRVIGLSEPDSLHLRYLAASRFFACSAAK